MALRGLTAAGGGDNPEDWISALSRVSTGAISFRPGPKNRVVVLVGTSPSHDPSGGVTVGTATSQLRAAGIRVVAANLGGLDDTGQAQQVVQVTGGSLLAGVQASAISNAILSGLSA